MSKFHPGDIVVYKAPNPNREPLYLEVVGSVPCPVSRNTGVEIVSMICGKYYIPEEARTTNELYTFFEDEVQLVDMKGAYI